MKKRINKKLTIKQAKIIKIIILAIFFILFGAFILDAIIGNIIEEWIIFLGICISACALTVLGIVLNEILEPITEPVIDIGEKKKVLNFLDKEMFTELSFTPKNDNGGSEYEMLLTIIKTMECRFLAKLDENDEIILVVKDKEDNEILYSSEISNYSYFNARFKPKSN